MTVIPFPARPSDDHILAAVYKLSQDHPSWTVELLRADDGMPYVVAESHHGGHELGAHWGEGGWAIADHLLRVIRKDRDLIAALGAAMTNAGRP